MRVGAPKEIKDNEFRVALTPAGAGELARRGHVALVERGAGAGAGFGDADYEAAGATLVDGAEALYGAADLIVKVKEPQPRERALLRPGQILFAYLHLAADRALTQDLMRSGAFCIAYERVTSSRGDLPLLTPMSEIAGRLAPQAGARCLEKSMGGRGVLLSGAPGVPPAEIVVLGAGTVGTQAAAIALGMGASVTVADRAAEPLRRLATRLPGAKTIFSTAATIAGLARRADLIIGAALVPGAPAPKLIGRALLAEMKPGAAIVDVAIDQGGCCESSRPTTHSEPTYIVDGIVHYCVANMPGVVPRTATLALTSATLPFVLALADAGLGAPREDPFLRAGLEIAAGAMVDAEVAAAFGLDLVPADRALRA